MKFNLNNFLSGVSLALDFVEIDFLGATSNHARRVAYISQRLAEQFGLNEDEQFDLFSYAMLHDNGLCEDVLQTGIPDQVPEDRHAQLERYTLHCDIGEKNVAAYPFLTGQRNIIRYHHEKFDGSGFFGLTGTEIPQMAQIIALADTVDNLFHFETRDPENRVIITDYIVNNRGKAFAPALVDAFLGVSSHTSFWLDMQEPFIDHALARKAVVREIEISTEELFEITRIFARIIDSKSKFTCRHTSGLMEKAEIMADHYKFDREWKTQLLIAASLHDLGKLAIPTAILNKDSELTEKEFAVIKEHTYYTRAALSRIDGFENICNWAANHHEKLDVTGYPYGISAHELGFEERLMSCLDMYQALTEDRPYRPGMDHESAMEIMRKNVRSSKIDEMIVRDIDRVFKKT